MSDRDTSSEDDDYLNSYEDEVEEYDDHLDGYEEEEDQIGVEEDDYRNDATPLPATSLDEDELLDSINEVTQSVSSLLSLPPDACSILLRNFRWDVLKLQDMWFSDEHQARKSAGLLPLTSIDSDGDRCRKNKGSVSVCVECSICFTCYGDSSALDSAACGHLFCKCCWNQYIAIAINDGPGCLALRCPEPKCSVSLDDTLIKASVSADAIAKYTRFLASNFVECSKGIQWCPAPGCQYAIQYTESDRRDVSCRCSYTFCWHCAGEPHRPVDCDTALKWHAKNISDTGNAEWMLANSKPCPACHKSIEKNQGCNHMVCQCGHHFCWICLGPWTEHKDYYSCNRYETKDQKFFNEESERKMAKISWKKYNHFYQRWLNNQMSRQKAIDSLKSFQEKTTHMLSELYGETDANIERSFVCAWKQIVEGRRALKWTYAYGYYLAEEEKDKRTLFEDMQGQAEAALERLHHCVEAELKKYLYLAVGEDGGKERARSQEFSIYKLKVIELTNVTRNFFNNLVGGLENRLV
uniref:RBR-type E3 ubiquitin transferase n=1 Tax=Kalanchoe fedtschenkoi TaxID=63787 RepID=A0A7N0V8N8_KALFE